MGQTLSLLQQPDLPEFNLTSARPPSREHASSPKDDGEEWQTIENGRPTKKKKIPKKDTKNYPEFHFSRESRLHSEVKISDIQNLVLYILADGNSPQFIAVRHRNEIRKVVVLMVPGLEHSMFELEGEKGDPKENEQGRTPEKRERDQDRHHGNHSKNDSPDPHYYPKRLKAEMLPAPLQPFANMFDHLWPVKTPGDEKYGKMHSPFQGMIPCIYSLIE